MDLKGTLFLIILLKKFFFLLYLDRFQFLGVRSVIAADGASRDSLEQVEGKLGTSANRFILVVHVVLQVLDESRLESLGGR